MENDTLNCKQCGARVRDEWRSKWNHVFKVHPELVASHLLPLIENPRSSHRFGEALGGWLKRRYDPVENSRLKCKQCGARVRDEWRSKWNHLVKIHPEIVASHLVPMIENPLEAHWFGEVLSGWLKRKVIQ